MSNNKLKSRYYSSGLLKAFKVYVYTAKEVVICERLLKM